jgi:hypothetical protein
VKDLSSFLSEEHELAGEPLTTRKALVADNVVGFRIRDVTTPMAVDAVLVLPTDGSIAVSGWTAHLLSFFWEPDLVQEFVQPS